MPHPRGQGIAAARQVTCQVLFAALLQAACLRVGVLVGAQEAQLTCMTILRMAEEDRRSYSAMDRSLPADASRSASAGLNLTAVTVSEPQDSSLMGSERSWSQMSTWERKGQAPPMALSESRVLCHENLLTVGCSKC